MWSYRPYSSLQAKLLYTSWSDQTSVVLQTNVVGMIVSSLQAKLLYTSWSDQTSVVLQTMVVSSLQVRYTSWNVCF